MKRIRTAIAIAAGLLVLCSGAQADSEEDRTAVERHDERSAESPEARRQSGADGTGQSGKRADTDRPAMPIPIPGVGREASPDRLRGAVSELLNA